MSVFVRLQFLYITLRSSGCFRERERERESKVRQEDWLKFIVQGTELGTNTEINYESIHNNIKNLAQHNWGNRVEKTQIDAKLILSIFRQPLHVSGVSRLIIRRYNCMYTTIGTYYFFR